MCSYMLQIDMLHECVYVCGVSVSVGVHMLRLSSKGKLQFTSAVLVKQTRFH